MGKTETTLVMLPGLDGTGLLFEPLVAALPSDIRGHTVAYPPIDGYPFGNTRPWSRRTSRRVLLYSWPNRFPGWLR